MKRPLFALPFGGRFALPSSGRFALPLGGRVLLVVGIVFALGGTGTAQTESLAKNDQRLAELAWLEGTWTGEIRGVRQEEIWTAPRGGMLLGLHRDVRGEGRAFFEYLRIESTEDGVFYVASPRGKPGVPFALVSHSNSRAVFENPEHDFPQRITYELDGDALVARIASITDKTARTSEWRWQRVDD